MYFKRITLFFTLITGACLPAVNAAQKSELNVLFIGNSYTARHNLATVVKDMAEAGNPGLTFNTTQVIYGGRTLADHWRLGSQHIVNQHAATRSEIETTIASLEKAVKDPDDRYAASGLKRMKEFLQGLETHRQRWDLVVLQSYRDDLEGDASSYMQYAPKFVELVKRQGARAVLYVTTPTTQNEEPLTSVPDKAPILDKTRSVIRLANKLEVKAAPMTLVAHRCQTQRPDLTLRFINDAHLNQTLAYLTACTLYAAIFDKSPEGLPVSSVTDIRFFENDRSKDRDGLPITKVFSDKDRADLQRIAWEGYLEFESMR
ncbi:MAG: hypothetical protein KJT03_20190 [Verrucomicrobiae bacterium]|nr:hypothetical protein [Verrucomicrobiae bacterium]